MRTWLLPLCLLALGCSTSGPAPADLPGDGPGAEDLRGADLFGVAPLAFIDLDTLYQDCMPPARPDPLLLKGRLTIRNQGALSLGPISAPGGTIFNKDDKPIATFKLADGALGTIGPNGSLEAKVVEKAAASLMPATACQAVPCNEAVRVELTLEGANLPGGSKAKSAPTSVVCAF